MSENVTLKLLRCPTCGAELKAENDSAVITCVYCGNSIVPVSHQAGNSEGISGTTVRVEGLKTPSSALAYLELFFEEYDWDAFSYANALSIGEIDELAASLKASAADDPNTWLVCFRALAVPFTHKVAGCQRILTQVIEAYQQDNPDVYSMFDAYKRLSGTICRNQAATVANLKKIAEKAEKYGVIPQDLAVLQENIHTLEQVSVKQFPNLDSIPEIHAFNKAKNDEIRQKLAVRGIDAAAQYQQAKTLAAEKKYQEALSILLSLDGYEDTDKLIRQIDRQFRIDDVLEVSGRLYCLEEVSDSDNEVSFSLFEATEAGLLAPEPIVQQINKVVANYADTLYYLTDRGKLKKIDLSTKVIQTIFDGTLHTGAYYIYNWKGYFYAQHHPEDEPSNYELVQVDLMTGAIKSLLTKVADVVSVKGNMLIYTVREAKKADKEDSDYLCRTRIINVQTREILDLGTAQITVHGFLNNCAIYTKNAPNQYNRHLYTKSFCSQEPEQLIERNIFRFHNIEAGLLFYYIGNSGNQTLISIRPDGTGRRQWPSLISDIHAELGGWLYFTRRSGYNSVFCRSRLDGSRFKVIAANPDEFLELKNGYLYYLTGTTLMRVRMDGSNQQTLCHDVQEVLSIDENKIIFLAIDDRIKTEGEEPVTKIVKSIYAVELSDSGKSKLAYNIKDAAEYDEDTIYYIAATEKRTDDSTVDIVDVLYRLSVESGQSVQLLELKQEETKPKMGCAFAALLISSLLSFLFGFLFMQSDMSAFSIMFILVGVVTLLGALFKKIPKQED